MRKIVECVPNFSEGRDPSVIEAILHEIRCVEGVVLLDSDMGADTNRTVVTFIGEPESVKEAAFRAIKKASELIDMSKHKGAHPRMGATDVCPFIPVSGVTMQECVELARELGKRVGNELYIPVYLYEYAATRPERKNLAAIRAGEYEGLREKIKKPQWKPDFGPAEFNPRSGATVIGAREFLIAYNVNLNTKDKKLASEIALTIRESGRKKRDEKGKFVRDKNGVPITEPGLLKHVKAVGWYIEEYGMAQVSINLVNFRETPLHQVYETCKKVAFSLGVEVTGSEVVGLIPKDALLEAGRYYLKRQMSSPGVPEEELIRVAVQSLGLSEISPFKPEEKIIEYRVKKETPLVNMRVRELVNEVSVDSPAPGGGSVAALSGALGSALAAMVGNLSANKRKLGIPHYPKRVYGEMLEKLYQACEEAQRIKDLLLDAVDEDTQAFNKVIDALKMPSITEEEKMAKEEALEEGYKEAAKVPLRTVELCSKVFPIAKMMAEHGNPGSVTDAAVAALMANAGLRGAVLNVEINLNSIKDEEFKKELKKRLEHYLKLGMKAEKEILEIVKKKMGEE